MEVLTEKFWHPSSPSVTWAIEITRTITVNSGTRLAPGSGTLARMLYIPSLEPPPPPVHDQRPLGEWQHPHCGSH